VYSNPTGKYKTYKKSRAVRIKGIKYDHRWPYFVTICTKDKIPLFSKHELAECAFQEIKSLSKQLGILSYAYVVMPDHIHWLFSFDDPDLTLSQLIGRYKGLVASEMRKRYEIQNVWQKSYYDHVLRKQENVYNIAQYLYENPKRKGLVEEEGDYEFSYLNKDALFL
jgi:putative transposase